MSHDNNMKRVRRHSLKPLEKRESSPASKALMVSAWAQLVRNATAVDLLPFAKQMFSKARKENGRPDLGNPEVARGLVDLAVVLLNARMMSAQEHTFYVCSAVSRVNEDRLFDSVYPEIVDIEGRMRDVEKRHGLKADEYWPKSEAPPEYRALLNEYDEAAEKRFIETLKEFEADDLVQLYKEDKAEYDGRRERGRRLIFHRDEHRKAIFDTVRRYETEAGRSASVGAYTGAVILLGAAVEGLLLLRCFNSEKKARSVALSLPSKVRPSNKDLLHWNFDGIIEVCLAAGWLPVVKAGSFEIRPDLLAHLLRAMRNGVHAGHVARERPWIATEREDFEQAEAIYSTIYATVFSRSSLEVMTVESRTDGA